VAHQSRNNNNKSLYDHFNNLTKEYHKIENISLKNILEDIKNRNEVNDNFATLSND
jgi:hypothetical protein